MINNNFSSSKKTFQTETVVFVLSILFFYVFIAQIPSLIVLFTILVSLFLFFVLCRWKSLSTNFSLLIALVFVVMLPGLLKVDQGLNKFFYFYMVLVIFIFCWISSYFPVTLLKAVNAIFYTFSIFVSISLFNVWGSPEPLGLIIPGSSQNGIPSYFIILVSAMLFLSFHLKGSFPIFPIFITFFVSFLGEGRGSLIVSAYLLLCVIFFSFFLHKSKSIFVSAFRFLFFLAVISIFMSYSYDIYEFVSTRTKLSVGLLDYNRSRILESYLNSLSIFGLFIGSGYEQTVIDSEYGSNPHISYIRLHSFFGLAAVFCVLLSPLILFFKGLSMYNLYLVALLYGMLLRAATEPVLFPTLLDFFYFSCIFTFFRKYKT